MKKKILLQAIDLFNEKGFLNVRVRDISSAMDVSPGSISYHYPSNEGLMIDIYRYMVANLEETAIARSMMVGIGFMEVARLYAENVYKFRFFFQDTLDIIRAYPSIARLYRKRTRIEIQTLTNIVHMAVGNGTLIPEPQKGLYGELCEIAWMTIHFWFARSLILGKEKEGIERGLLYTSRIGLPYFTEKGLEDLRIFEEKVNRYSSIGD